MTIELYPDCAQLNWSETFTTRSLIAEWLRAFGRYFVECNGNNLISN